MWIRGLGCSFPAPSVDQPDAADQVCRLLPFPDPEQKRLRAVFRRTGVKKRHSVQVSPDGTFALYPSARDLDDRGPTTEERLAWYEREAGPLAVRAAEAAIGEAGVDPASFTHLTTVSCTGFAAPGVDADLAGALGLPAGLSRTHIGFVGCHGALTGLRTARAFAESGGRALMVAVELCSLHFQYPWSFDNVVANALFADGAAAVVAEPGTGPWTVAACGSHVFPDSREAMTWNVTDHGFTLTLSPKVPSLIETGLRPWVEEFLGAQGLALGDVRSFAVHPGGPKILDSVEEALSMPPDSLAVSRKVLAEYGNMSSPTVLVILERMRRRDAPLPCLALAFGPGLTAEAALII
ncbi:MAG: type III polyketide synthase [Planctomycetota bacterium]